MILPKGFMLVPIEATAVMMNAGVEAAGEATKPSWPGAGSPGFVQIRAAWAAMLEVAPSPPDQPPTNDAPAITINEHAHGDDAA